MTGHRDPSARRALIALLLAPVLPVLLVEGWDSVGGASTRGEPSIGGAALFALYALVMAEGLTVVLGGVALAALWHRTRMSLPLAAMVGGAVAAVPFAAIKAVPAIDLCDSGTYSGSYNGHLTFIANEKTPHGLWRDVVALGQWFGLGAIGGATFRLICRPGTRSAGIDAS